MALATRRKSFFKVVLLRLVAGCAETGDEARSGWGISQDGRKRRARASGLPRDARQAARQAGGLEGRQARREWLSMALESESGLSSGVVTHLASARGVLRLGHHDDTTLRRHDVNRLRVRQARVLERSLRPVGLFGSVVNSAPREPMPLLPDWRCLMMWHEVSRTTPQMKSADAFAMMSLGR